MFFVGRSRTRLAPLRRFIRFQEIPSPLRRAACFFYDYIPGTWRRPHNLDPTESGSCGSRPKSHWYSEMECEWFVALTCLEYDSHVDSATNLLSDPYRHIERSPVHASCRKHFLCPNRWPRAPATQAIQKCVCLRKWTLICFKLASPM